MQPRLFLVLLFMLLVQQTLTTPLLTAQILSEWQTISPTTMNDAENVLITTSNRVLVLTRSIGIWEVPPTPQAPWTLVSQNIPELVPMPPRPDLPKMFRRMFAYTVADSGVYGHAGPMLFLDNTQSAWESRSSNSALIYTALGLLRQTLYAGAGTLVPNSDAIRISNDGGRTWQQKMGGIGANSVSAVSFIPTSVGILAGTSLGIFLASSNESDWRQTQPATTNQIPWYIFKAHDSLLYAQNRATKAIIVSHDAGRTWSGERLNGFDGDTIFTIARNDKVILLGSNTGIFVSSNNGATWSRVSSSAVNRQPVLSMAIRGTSVIAVSNGRVLQATLQSATTSVWGYNADENFTITHNSASKVLYIRFAQTSPKASQIHVFNALGQMLFSEEVLTKSSSKGELVFHVGTLPRGVYWCSVYVERGVLTRKFVVE